MHKQKRLIYLLLFIATIPLGLATRKFGYALPTFIRDFGGDTLYATCIFFAIGFVANQASLFRIGALSWIFCICIELLQLYQAPWIQNLRHTFPFGLILGYGFLWSDWLCYTVGVIIAFVIAYFIERSFLKRGYIKKE